MYTRSYYDTSGEIHELPAGYDGTALRELAEEDTVVPRLIPDEGVKKETKISPKKEVEEEMSEVSCKVDGDSGGFLSYIKGLFGRVTPLLSHFHFELEDLIILGLAAYLLFSKSSDIECAIMLVVLIFL